MTLQQSVPVVLVAILVAAPPTALILRGAPLLSMFVNMGIGNMQQRRPEPPDEKCALPDLADEQRSLPSRTDEQCVDYSCPCGFKARLDQAESYCLGPKCDWGDRDVCCTADFRAGLFPSCYGAKPIVDDDNLQNLLSLSESRLPINPEWPTLLDENGFLEPVTSPMLHEMAMDAYRGCAAAFGCESEDSWMDCGSCVSTHCSGLDPDTMRPKAAPWYPNISGTSENFLYQFTCESCYLSDPNGRGDGRKACSGTDDWLAACTADTPDWKSGDGKTCDEYVYEMQAPMLFHNVTIKREVKQNCCKTWQCTTEENCPSTVTTTTPAPQIDLSMCPHDEGRHDVLACPCHKFVSQFMGYTPWRNIAEEQKMRANCWETAGIYEAVKNGETDTAESV